MTMTVTRGLSDVRPRPYPVATIGNFDGHHRGHRALLQTVVERAKQRQGTAIVLTFEPHPIRVLAPHVDLKFLTSPEEKLSRFEAAGVDEVVYLEFTSELAAMAAEEFANHVLHRSLGIAEIFVGEHFAFGKGRSGRIDDLVRFGNRLGFAVHPFAPITVNGEVVSSTRIRHCIQSGDMARAAALLGRVYGITGPVISGRQQGQAMGWPTANLSVPVHRVLPPDGVYAGWACLEGVKHDAAVYIGTRPTFATGERLIEAYLLNHNQDLYGQPLTVEFVERLRGDCAFGSPEALSAQIARDVEQVTAILRRQAGSVGV
ncbi:Riboflavin biosynthesis protein RibF [Nitrospira sp. KM1]|uniref:bifunctional riboflavin kinase/FAD synthetase n=1 Tax=Nitrospira sp. KM1 TaxID=1936990 RepID=UPI0013A7994C|nr:bifunctional riboflavin kinase/FAD synthetase [Nitrospira sp. KM1]BCA53670.1 Riboflavin biosynthesis protein RibF [Nitrospira sp. KM1]